jgi:ribosomal protein L11 methyltransferase
VSESAPECGLVAGCLESELEQVRSIARLFGGSEVSADRRGRDHLIVEFRFLDPESADAALGTLRAAGIAAVAGPTSEGHRVAWNARNAPTMIGERAAVCFPWSAFDDSLLDLTIEIDPGHGFGSGGHPTTTLILEALLDLDLVGATVLDVGCGTGVLAIAAALLGARHVVATDIAEPAMVTTECNARRNRVDGAVEIVSADIATLGEPFDVVLANIHAGVLVDLGAHLRRLTLPNGLLGLSGLSPAQTSVVAAAMRPMDVYSERGREGWTSIWLRHPIR